MIPASDIRPMGDEELRAEVRAWLAANWKNDLPPAQQWKAGPAHIAWYEKVVDARWAVNRWPAAWYGRDLSDHQAKIVERAFRDVGAPGAGLDRSQNVQADFRNFGGVVGEVSGGERRFEDRASEFFNPFGHFELPC